MTFHGYGLLQRPPVGAALDWTQPITEGLAAAAMFNEGVSRAASTTIVNESVSRQHAAVVAGSAATLGVTGFVQDEAHDAGGTPVGFPRSPFLPNDLSFFALVNLQVSTITLSDVYRAVIARGSVFDNATNFVFGFRPCVASTAVERLFLYQRDGGGVLGGAEGAASQQTTLVNVFRTIGATWIGATIKLYRNGQVVETITGNTKNGTDGGQALTFGGPTSFTSTDRNFAGITSAAYVWRRGLSDAEMAELGADPYIVFRPPAVRRVFFEFVAPTGTRVPYQPQYSLAPVLAQ